MRSAMRAASSKSWVYEDGGHREPAPNLAQLRVEALPRDLVDRGKRLVEEQNLRIASERPRDRHALLLAAGELGGRRPSQAAEMHEVEQVARPLPRIGLVVQRRLATLPSAVMCGNSA